MAVTAMTIIAERWLDEVILNAQVLDNAGATIAEDFTLPAGLGDVAIMSVTVGVFNITTAPTVPETPRGVQAFVLTPTSQLVESIGVAPFVWIAGATTVLTRVSAFLDPDALVLMRQNETIRLLAPEMDVDASPTGDLELIVKAVRVRPIEGAVKGPLRLVNVTDM